MTRSVWIYVLSLFISVFLFVWSGAGISFKTLPCSMYQLVSQKPFSRNQLALQFIYFQTHWTQHHTTVIQAFIMHLHYIAFLYLAVLFIHLAYKRDRIQIKYIDSNGADIVIELQKITFQRTDQQVRDNCRKICERYGRIDR